MFFPSVSQSAHEVAHGDSSVDSSVDSSGDSSGDSSVDSSRNSTEIPWETPAQFPPEPDRAGISVYVLPSRFSVGAKRVLHEVGRSVAAGLSRTGKFINCEDGLEIPW